MIRFVLFGIVLGLGATGCVSSQEPGHCSVGGTDCDCGRPDDFCNDAVPTRPGTYTDQWTAAMRCSARNQDLIVYRNAWFNGGVEPGPEAVEDLHRFSETMRFHEHYHLIVEAEPVQPLYSETLSQASERTRRLDTSRLQRVVAELEAAGIIDAATRVHLSPLESVGTRGIEAPRVFNQMFFGAGQNQGNTQGGGRGGGGGRGF